MNKNIVQIEMDLEYKNVETIENSSEIKIKKQNTIVDKVVYLLGASEENIIHLSDMYEKLKAHTKSSIRGNLNRYISKMKENSIIKRVIMFDEEGKEIKGYYTLSEIVKVKKDEETGKVLINYMAKYNVAGDEVAFIHRDFEIDTKEDITPGVYKSEQIFDDLNDVFSKKESLESVIVNADARDILNRIESNTFDLLITDPPYRVISGGKPKKKGQPSGMLSKNDGKIFKHNDIKFSEWVPEVYRVLKEGAHAYIFTNLLNLWELKSACVEAGFKIHNLLVWEKNNAVVNRWYMKNCEYVLFLRKGAAKAIIDSGSKTVHQFQNIIGNKLQPTEKPSELLQFYANNSSSVGDWVLDPFGGSLSLARTLLGTGIKTFSIEKDRQWYNNGIIDLGLKLNNI